MFPNRSMPLPENKVVAEDQPSAISEASSQDVAEQGFSIEEELEMLRSENVRLKAENEQLGRGEFTNRQVRAVLDDIVPRKKQAKPKIIAPMEVRAIERGFYNLDRKEVGEVFVIQGEHELGRWMEKTGTKIK